MKTLSNNYNGIVKQTSERGFSVKTTARKLYDFAKVNAGDPSIEIAKTGSSYLEFELNGVYYSIRVSNHTKRSYNIDIQTKVYVSTYDVWIDAFNHDLGKTKQSVCDFEILNTETKKILFSHLGIN